MVTFQQLNPRVARYHYKRRLPPHLSRSRWDIAPERNAQPVNVSHVPSLQQSNTIHNVDSYQSSEQYSQRLSFREKVRQVFMRLRRPENCERNSCVDIEKGNESAGFYHFDHGETSYYRTTDRLPHLTSDIVAQRVHDTFTRFWAEIFGFINVFVTLIITFLIQFYR